MKLYILLHGHHLNDNGCPLSIGGQSLAERKAEIKKRKPTAEQPVRLASIRNVKPKELPAACNGAWASCNKAWAAYDKAWAAYDKARASCNKEWAAKDAAWAAYDKVWAAYDKARASCNRAWTAKDAVRAAYDKAWAAFFYSLTPAQWECWHKKVCEYPDCKWTAEHPSIF